MKKSKIFYVFILFLSLFLFLGCEKKIEKPLVLSANVWIGYAPLYYAYEKGWLRQNDIKFVATLSLGETLKYYKKGSIDVFAGTQYEYIKAKNSVKDLTAIKLLDISKSGDLIYANKGIDELRKADKIDVFLETNSINSLLLKKFTKRYGLKKEQLNLMNERADATLNLKMRGNPTLIVTYKPYDMHMEKEGYKKIATAKSLGFTIFDALFSSKRYIQKHQKELKKLVVLFQRALGELKKDPHGFYIVIKPDFYYKKYDDFKEDLKSISWTSSKSLKYLLNQSGTR